MLGAARLNTAGIYTPPPPAHYVLGFVRTNNPTTLFQRRLEINFGVLAVPPISAPDALSSPFAVQFSPDGAFIARTSTISPFISAAPFDPTTGFSADFSPAQAATNLSLSFAWHPSGSHVVTNIANTGARAYGFNNGFTNVNFDKNLVLNLTNFPNGQFNSSGNTYGIGIGAVNQTVFMPFSQSTGFGSVASAFSSLPASTVRCWCWHPTLDVVTFGLNVAPFFVSVPWNGSSFDAALPTAVPGFTQCFSIGYDNTGTVLFTRQGGTQINAYAWSAAGPGVLLDTVATTGAASTTLPRLIMSPDNKWLVNGTSVHSWNGSVLGAAIPIGTNFQGIGSFYPAILPLP